MLDSKIIAVDLDGTLTFTDTLHESIMLMIREKPLLLFALPFWLSKGRASLKSKVAYHVKLDVTSLPYNEPLIKWLKKERAGGKKIILCSATNESIAHSVAEHLKIFDDVIASDANTNIKSSNKCKVLNRDFGENGYDYVGNSNDDLEVWAGANKAILVNASDSVLKKANKAKNVSKIFPSHEVTLSVWLKAIRIHQWLKNLLLFLPLLAAHQIDNSQLFFTLILAFISFSLCASAIYIVNDLMDLESDRKHPRKYKRPFAVAALSIVSGVMLALICIAVSFLLGLKINSAFFIWLLIYFILSITYSLVLKRFALLDCLALATLYTLRIVAGGAAVYVSVSFWLLAFSVFIFLSLAFVKRYAELLTKVKEGDQYLHGRGYTISDASIIQILGIVSGYSSILVLALYLQGGIVTALYIQPIIIWLVVPLLLFWISWVWLKAHRGEMHDDPILFAIKDKASLIVAGLTIISFLLATKGIGS